MLDSKELSKQIKGWHSIRDLVIKNEVDAAPWLFSDFDKEVLDIILHDLSISMSGTIQHKEWSSIINKIIMENTQQKNKFANVSDFNVPYHIKYLSLDRVDAASVNSKFADKFGKTNRLTFMDMDSKEEKIFSSTSWAMLKAFKDSKVVSGDECIVVSVSFKDPYKDITYRQWIVQKINNTPKEQEKVNAISDAKVADNEQDDEFDI